MTWAITRTRHVVAMWQTSSVLADPDPEIPLPTT